MFAKFVPTFKIVKVKWFFKYTEYIDKIIKVMKETIYLLLESKCWPEIFGTLFSDLMNIEYLKHKFNIITQSGSRFLFTYNTFQTCSYLFLQA